MLVLVARCDHYKLTDCDCGIHRPAHIAHHVFPRTRVAMAIHRSSGAMVEPDAHRQDPCIEVESAVKSQCQLGGRYAATGVSNLDVHEAYAWSNTLEFLVAGGDDPAAMSPMSPWDLDRLGAYAERLRDLQVGVFCVHTRVEHCNRHAVAVDPRIPLLERRKLDVVRDIVETGRFEERVELEELDVFRIGLDVPHLIRVRGKSCSGCRDQWLRLEPHLFHLSHPSLDAPKRLVAIGGPGLTLGWGLPRKQRPNGQCLHGRRRRRCRDRPPRTSDRKETQLSFRLLDTTKHVGEKRAEERHES